VLVSNLVMKNSLVNSSLLANLSEANAKNLETIVSLIADLLVCLSTPEDTRSVLFDSCYASCNFCIQQFCSNVIIIVSCYRSMHCQVGLELSQVT